MHIFPPRLEIGSLEGFTPEKDIFGREALGKGLTNLVKTVTDPMVIALDAPWGSGKTTFLEMWAGELRKADTPVVYFDAFAHDYIDDAFAAIAGEIIGLLEEAKKARTTKGELFVKKALAVSKITGIAAAKIATTIATAGILQGTTLDGLADALAEDVGGLSEGTLKQILIARKHKDTIEEFKTALASLPAELRTTTANAFCPLVVIIDELDRCRPSFALELLERIKHFFSVTNVHFVMGVNLTQLRNSVWLTYGPKLDADSYLQKFMSVRVSFDDGFGPTERSLGKYLSYLQTKMQFADLHYEIVRQTILLIKRIELERNVTLRMAEKMMTVVALAVTQIGASTLLPLFSSLCIMKVVDPDLFAKAKVGSLSYKEVTTLFNSRDKRDDGYDMEFFEECWTYALSDNVTDAIKLRFNHGGGYRFSERHRLVPRIATQVVDRLKVS